MHAPNSLLRTLAPWPMAAALALAGCASATSPPTSQQNAPPIAPPPPALSTPSTPADPHTAEFSAWRAAFTQQALAAGIRPDTVRDVLGQAQWLPRVVELDRSQPEFTRPPWVYLDSAASPQRIANGQAKRAEHQAVLDAAAARYGVPAPVLTAIWGLESNFGQNFGSFRTVDALATLAHEGRRRAWAQGELLAALRIVDQDHIGADRMVGSWAGAMGHTQFMPTVFLAYAVDADGDGQRDIWGSIPDVAASTAHFLARSGWRSGEPWGAEVRLPPGFDYTRAELSVRQGAAQWAAEGVQAVEGQTLPTLAEASILAPAGARGPAFLVGPNFRTLLRYNNAVNYALGVALLAQQIDGGPGVVAAWPRDLQPLSREQVRTLQTALNERGFDTGKPDGVAGPATRAGLRRYQQSVGAVADGYPTLELLERLTAQP
ncbi:lytic murein transglycosylase [Acidovorax sp. NO-1]|uniref:lytic murein transglycosylase n=1 Tax=Acidovorax sp. NO-1 TaxID=512030 RepID=UPI0005522AE7|nr:lytic murein transglycosylase [Acidovorax sp. NO-1]